MFLSDKKVDTIYLKYFILPQIKKMFCLFEKSNVCKP